LRVLKKNLFVSNVHGPEAGAKWGRRAPEAEMKLQVECYSGRKAEAKPVRFRLDEHSYEVAEVLDQWYGPEDIFYKVRAGDGNFYILKKQTSTPEGAWSLVSFRQPAKAL
jgi:hypothetical protein